VEGETNRLRIIPEVYLSCKLIVLVLVSCTNKLPCYQGENVVQLGVDDFEMKL